MRLKQGLLRPGKVEVRYVRGWYAFESDSERIPRSLQVVRQFDNSLMVKYTTKNIKKESH
jgi:hypothetical protein